ncbi:heparinase II/III family protein [Lichenibacterium ramalinae]|uniref:Heparinase n=1 Tax=Lichenibacterium ramalinae TaxID=2316527 RepID=A0A4Q2RJK8_9HYPH|nr:heparinase II/III family protein [Lichenibacterium ramalinae]RYB07742.1 heparinase [Lichenibacterium ramalinae]
MKDETVADRARLTALVLARRLRHLGFAARRPVRGLATRRSRVPERLLIAPQDIRTADPTVAADIYSGYFVFDGKAVNTRGASPFDVDPPTEAWAAALAGFGWLRHLRAAETALARVNARALVGDWIAGAARMGGPGTRPDVTARRLLSWLSQSPLILEGADAVFYRAFTRSLTRQADTLLGIVDRGLGGTARLTALVALCEVALCAEGMARLQRKASRLLADELGRQILPDGGHVSRDPQALLDLLLDLLPLRQAYAAREVAPPPPLLNAIDRMMPMVRCFRHGDGALALFNGMGSTRPDVLATVLAYDDARGAALTNARYSGYQRLDAGDASLIVDAGCPPPPTFAARAHAGTLAFEFSHGAQRLIVNCGAAPEAQPAAREASRATAAHSTLVLGDRSSSRFAQRGSLRGILYTGPRVVTAERGGTGEGEMLDLSHDGYARRGGYVHGRRLWLSADGLRLAGEDRLVPAEGRKPVEAGFTIRFHLHPALRAVAARHGTAALIAGPDGAHWLFEAGGLPVAIEEGIFFANPDGPRRAEQIVVHGDAANAAPVAWSLAWSPARDAGQGEG